MNTATLRLSASPRRSGSRFQRWLVRLAAARGVAPHRLGAFDLARSALAGEVLKATRR